GDPRAVAGRRRCDVVGGLGRAARAAARVRGASRRRGGARVPRGPAGRARRRAARPGRCLPADRAARGARHGGGDPAAARARRSAGGASLAARGLRVAAADARRRAAQARAVPRRRRLGHRHRRLGRGLSMNLAVEELVAIVRLAVGLVVPLAGAALGGTIVAALIGRLLGVTEPGFAAILRVAAVVLALALFAMDTGARVVDETARVWSALADIGRGRR